jgi:glycosyltransferase involved in cell wall biosynthesis
MITTFFGPHSFGGDAAYVDRLSRVLLRSGHEVEVIYNIDAFEAVRGNHPLRSYEPPQGLRIHGLREPWGRLGLLWTHQTGRMSTLRRKLEERLAEGKFDVIHFHNISLIGGMEVLSVNDPGNAVRLMTAHDHWLLCPLSLLWKQDSKVCDRPTCISCTLAAGRPPQAWRYTGLRGRMLGHLDALLVPSSHTQEIHRARGVERAIVRLPYFLPDPMGHTQVGQTQPDVTPWRPSSERPYFAAAGRFIKEKGFSQVIVQMRHLPQADLILAGTGPYEATLRAEAAGLPNVQFAGLLAYPDLFRLYQGARALIVPSLFHETFGYVVLEAFSAGTPAIVHDRGALPELIRQSGAGDVYGSEAELLATMKRYLEDANLARTLGEKGKSAHQIHWSEAQHIEQYLELINAARRERLMRTAPLR